MKYQGRIGLVKVYVFLMLYLSYQTFLSRTEIEPSILIIISAFLAASAFLLYKSSKGWIVAALTPLPFLFVTVAVISRTLVGQNHFLTICASALLVLSIPVLGLISVFHNSKISQKTDSEG